MYHFISTAANFVYSTPLYITVSNTLGNTQIEYAHLKIKKKKKKNTDRGFFWMQMLLLINDFYLKLRMSQYSQDSTTVTPRQLESLVRPSQVSWERIFAYFSHVKHFQLI